MPGVQAGDEVLVTFQDNGGGQANFVFKDLNGNWVKVGENGSTNPDWIDKVVTDTEYVFPISAAWAEALAVNGLYIDGQHVTVKSVKFHAKNRTSKPEITEGGDTPDPKPEPTGFSGTVEIQGLSKELGANWSGLPDKDTNKYEDFSSNVLWIKPEYLIDVKAGDAVQISMSSYEGGAKAQYLLYDSATPAWKKHGHDNGGSPSDYWDVNGAGPYRFNITASNIGLVQASGIYVDGHNCTVASVDFIYKNHEKEITEIKATDEEAANNYTTITLWEAGQDININKDTETKTTIEFGSTYIVDLKSTLDDNLAKAYHIPADKFFIDDGTTDTTADLDDCIVITFSNYSADAEASFYFKDSEGEWFRRGVGTLNDISSSFTVARNTYQRYIWNYRMVDAIRHNGLYIDGKNATISKIELRNYKNEALDDNFPRFYGHRKNEGTVTSTTERGYIVEYDKGDDGKIVWTTKKRIRHEAFMNYVNGERIVLYFNKTGENPQLRMSYIRPHSASMRMAQGLTGTDSGIAEKNEFTTLKDGRLIIVYRPTQREIRALKYNGLFLDGQDLQLDEISFGLAANTGDTDTSVKTQDIWVHNDWMTFGHDNGKSYEGDVYYSGHVKIYVSYIHFQRAKEMDWFNTSTEDFKGYKLTFYFPWVGEYATMTASYDSSKTYDSNRDPLNMYYDYAYGQNDQATPSPRKAEGEVVAESGYYAENLAIPVGTQQFCEYELKSDDVDKLVKYGMWITGSNADMQNIKLRSPMSVSGVEDAEEDINLLDVAINFNEPYEAWTIDGRRVADVESPGLYIVRQGTKVQKVLIR